MNFDINKTVNSAITLAKRNSPALLTACSVVAMGSACVLSGVGTVKAMEKAKEMERETDHVPSKMDYVKTCWKCYIPAVVMGTVSATCAIGAQKINSSRAAALAAAYTITDTALKDFKEKAVEVVGEKKVEQIEDKVAEKQIEKKPFSKVDESLIPVIGGTTLCFDSISARYFYSDHDYIMKRLNDFNHQLMLENYLTINDWYMVLGLEGIDDKIGSNLCWRVDDGLLAIRITSKLADTGVPCMVINYQIAPRGWGY